MTVVAQVGESASVMSRALGILACFEHANAPLTVRRIATATGIPLSSAYRLVNELTEWGALDRAEDGRYQVGMRLWELGQNAGRRLRDRARPFLHDLFEQTRENVNLAVREGNQALYVDKVYGSRRVPMVSRVGSRLPLHSTGVGRVLLAHQPEWFRESYLRRELEQPTPKSEIDVSRLEEQLTLVRQQGYAFLTEEMRLGACSIAVPVSVDGEVIAAVGIVLEATRGGEVRRLIPALRATSAQIARALVTYRVPIASIRS